MSSNISVTFHLFPQGKSFDFWGFRENGWPLKPTPEELKSVLDPLFIEKSTSCKTHETVLEFLELLQNRTDLKSKFNSFYHTHNWRYKEHSGAYQGIVKGRAHSCSLENMIDFVKLKISEKSTPHAFFNRVGETLGPFIGKLQKYSAKKPFRGFFPAVLITLIGVVQTVAGASFLALSLIPAICSKDARIFFLDLFVIFIWVL